MTRTRIFLFFIFLIAAALRFYGIDWDRGYLFHPDERQIMLVSSNLHFPRYPLEIFSTESPLNPKFFAYGSFPIYLLWMLGRFAPAAPAFFVPWSDHSLVNLLFFGRWLSAVFDLGTLVFIYLLARRLYDETVGLFAAACVAVTVLHIQLAHYYAVDTLLALLCTATVYFAARYAQIGRTREAVWVSIAFGLALATKATAFPLIAPIIVATIKARGKEVPSFYAKAGWKIHLRARLHQLWDIRRALAKIGLVVFITFIATQPYVVLDPVRYFGQVGTELLVARGWLDRPFTLQFMDTWPVVYQVTQVSIWGIGLPLALFAWGGSAYFVLAWWRQRDWADGFVLSWAVVYLLVSTTQFSKYPRYLIPLTPFLFLMAIVSIRYYAPDLSYKIIYASGVLVALGTLVYVFAFVGIYSREHPWFTISKWIYQNVPAQSRIAVEHWDDTLPVPIQVGEETRNLNQYQMQTLPMYDVDDDKKLQTILDTLSSSDYIILATERLSSSIPRASARYPITTRYYHALFDGSLGFELVAFARNDPTLGGIILRDDRISHAGLAVPPFLAATHTGSFEWSWGYEDESLNVYDHPMPLVFKKTRSLSAADLRAILK